MFSKSFMVFCSLIPLIWCESTRNDIKISSAPIAGGIIPSNSISLSTATGTKFVPGSGALKSQNVTLKMPLLSVSVKNTSSESVSNDIKGKVTDTLTNLVDKKLGHDLFAKPEEEINPEDIMLDLNIPVRVTELEDLSEVSSVEQFKQKMMSSSLLEKLFVDIEEKKKLYPALANLASALPLKRRRRKRGTNLQSKLNSSNDYEQFLQRHHNPNGVIHRIFYHYPKRTNSEIVYEPDPSRVRTRRIVNQQDFFHPSMRSAMVGVIHHPLPLPPLLPLVPPPPLLRAPIIPHHYPIHHPPHLPVIPPTVLAQILRARARAHAHHPLPPLIPIGLLPQIARSIGILPSQLLPSFYSSYPTEDIIIARQNAIQQHNILSSRYPFLQRSVQQIHSIPFTPPFGYSSSHHGPIMPDAHSMISQHSNPLYRGSAILQPVFVSEPRSIFDHLPQFRRRNDENNQQSSFTPFVQLPYWNLPTQLKIRNLQHTPTIHLAQPYNRPHANNFMNHHSVGPMTYSRVPRTIHLNPADSQEVLESLERTGTLLGNTLFSLIGHVPTITR